MYQIFERLILEEVESNVQKCNTGRPKELNDKTALQYIAQKSRHTTLSLKFMNERVWNVKNMNSNQGTYIKSLRKPKRCQEVQQQKRCLHSTTVFPWKLLYCHQANLRHDVASVYFPEMLGIGRSGSATILLLHTQQMTLILLCQNFKRNM